MDRLIILLAALSAALGAFILTRSARNPEQSVNPEAEDFVPASESAQGLRQNNPFNLRFNNIGWRGETGERNGFSVFDTAQNGIRAGMINIHTQMVRDNQNTVRKLITRLSPPIENPTANFITFVSARVGVSPDQTLIYRQHILQLSKAIIQFENGEQPFPDAVLRDALQETGKV